MSSIESRAPLVFSGSLTTWTTTSWPGLSRSVIFLPPSLPRPRRGLSTPGQHDLVDVQEAVLVEADVDERRLEAGQDVVDPALVDVADDRAAAAALEVELGDAVARRRGPPCGAPRAPARRLGGRRRRRLQQRDAGLPAVDADEHLLFHGESFF